MSNITNLNRDYLIKINVKEATIDVPKMTFWNTDKKTSNMFVQLVINMSTNELISQYVTVQNATDYKITLNVIKPKTKQYKTIEATLLNEEKALFEIDLPDEFTDQVGDYSFEFEVSSKVDSNDESITTSNGTYKVNGSILTNLNEETSSSPDLPILKQLIEQVKSLQGGDLTGYQKKKDETLETTSKEVVGAINEVNTQFKDIANLSLTKHSDGKVYIKKQDGTLIGDGIEIGGSDVDLSKITMSMSGQTLKLMNDGTQIATVEIPTAVVTDEQLTSIIQSKIDDGTITNMTIPDDSITTKKLNIAPKVVNIITNPDFSNGTTGYTLSSSTTVISDYGVEVTPTAQNGGIGKRDILFTNEHKIYVSALVKTNSSKVELLVYNPRFSRDIYYSNSGEFERLSDIFTSNSFKCNIQVRNTSDDSLPFIVKSFTCIDLTEAFGSGNEPDKEYMDEFLNGFNNGVIVDDGLQILGDTHIRNKRIDNILPKITKIDDTDENIAYYGAWTKETNSKHDNNSSHYSSDENSYMEYIFMGTGINIYDRTGHSNGIVEVFIDGVSKGTIDRYTSGMNYKSLMYSIKDLLFGIHTIRVVVTRTKNDKSSDYTFTFDYLEVVDYFPLNNTDEEKEISIYKAKILDNLSEVVKDSKLALFKHTNAVTIDSANPTIGSTTNPLKVNTYNSTKKALLKFDLSSLKGKKIKKAYLRLVCSNYNNNSILDTSFNINAILLPWDDTVSWNNYSNSNAWNTAGATGEGTDINSDTVNVGNIYNVEEYTNGFFADITTIVSNWNEDV